MEILFLIVGVGLGVLFTFLFLYWKGKTVSVEQFAEAKGERVFVVGKTQFIEPETIEEKFKKSDTVDEFLNQLDSKNE